MEPIVEEFTITLKYQVSVDTETGEMTTKCISRKIDKAIQVSNVKTKKLSSKKEDSSIPTLVLEENKYCLNHAAIELMGIEPDQKLDIKYEKRGNSLTPVLGTDEIFGTKQGNKLTKSLTVAFRGSKNEELSKYGTEFTLVPHESKEGVFILKNSDTELEQLLSDNAEHSDSEDLELLVDTDLQDLIDDEDAKITEVSSSMFKL